MKATETSSLHPSPVLHGNADHLADGSSIQLRALGEDLDLVPRLDRYAIEDVVEFKISRFLDQIGAFFPENFHELIMSKVEKPLISQILKRVGGNQVHAAKILGINRNTLRKKMKMYGL